MVCHDGTIRNSLGNLIQFTYEDGMHGACIESQYIETFGGHNYRVDITDPAAGFLPDTIQVSLDDSSAEIQALLDEEYGQLAEDCRLLRNFIFTRADPKEPHSSSTFRMHLRARVTTCVGTALSDSRSILLGLGRG